MEAKKILEKVRNGEISVEAAEKFFRQKPFDDLGFAKLDTHRKIRTGFGEVVFCSGKKGKHPLFGKWFFYVFYPLHYLIIWLVFVLVP